MVKVEIHAAAEEVELVIVIGCFSVVSYRFLFRNAVSVVLFQSPRSQITPASSL